MKTVVRYVPVHLVVVTLTVTVVRRAAGRSPMQLAKPARARALGEALS